MEELLIQELAEKVKRVNHRLKNQGNQSLLQLGIKTHRRIKRARSFEKAKYIGDEFYSDVKKRLNTVAPIGIAGGIISGISTAAPILNSDGYDGETGSDIDLSEETGASLASAGNTNEQEENTIETSGPADDVTDAQADALITNETESDEHSPGLVNEQEESPEEISSSTDDVAGPQVVASFMNESESDQDSPDQANEQEENQEETSGTTDEETEPEVVASAINESEGDQYLPDQADEQNENPEETSLPADEVAELQSDPSITNETEGDQHSADQENEEEETSVPADEPIAQQPGDELTDESENGTGTEIQTNESIGSPVTSAATTTTENESEDNEDQEAETSSNTQVADSPEFPAVTAGGTDINVTSDQSENEPHHMPLVKTFLGLVADPDSYDRNTAKTLLYELELSKRTSSGLDEKMIKDLGKRIESLDISIQDLQKPITVVDTENPDGRQVTKDGLAPTGITDNMIDYVGPGLKIVKTLSDQFLNVASAFAGPVGEEIKEGYDVVQHGIGLKQAIDEGNTAKGVSNALGLVSKTSADMSILSAEGKFIEAQDSHNQGKNEEAKVKALEAIGDSVSKIAKEIEKETIGKGVEIITSIPGAVHEIKEAIQEIKEISEQHEQTEQQKEKLIQMKDERMKELIQKREGLIDLKNRYHFANMEQTDKVINTIKEKYPDLKDEIKQELRKDVGITRKEWKHIIQGSGEGSEEKLERYKSRKK
jgi:hypothetical protein